MVCRDVWMPRANSFQTHWLDALPTHSTHSSRSIQLFLLDAQLHIEIIWMHWVNGSSTPPTEGCRGTRNRLGSQCGQRCKDQLHLSADSTSLSLHYCTPLWFGRLESERKALQHSPHRDSTSVPGPEASRQIALFRAKANLSKGLLTSAFLSLDVTSSIFWFR